MDDLKLNLEVTYDFMIVKRDKPKEISDGGIIIPEVGKLIPFKGTILGIGPGNINANGDLVPTPFKVGQRVQFHPNSAILLNHKFAKDAEEEEICVLKAYDAYAIITEEF